MRIRVHHVTTYAYQAPASSVIQVLRLTPSSHGGQHVIHWRVDVDVDGVLRQRRDAYGNILHLFFAASFHLVASASEISGTELIPIHRRPPVATGFRILSLTGVSLISRRSRNSAR